MQKVFELILVCLTDAWQEEVESPMDLSVWPLSEVSTVHMFPRYFGWSGRGQLYIELETRNGTLLPRLFFGSNGVWIASPKIFYGTCCKTLHGVLSILPLNRIIRHFAESFPCQHLWEVASATTHASRESKKKVRFTLHTFLVYLSYIYFDFLSHFVTVRQELSRFATNLLFFFRQNIISADDHILTMHVPFAIINQKGLHRFHAFPIWPYFRAWILGKDNLRVRIRTLYKIQNQHEPTSLQFAA